MRLRDQILPVGRFGVRALCVLAVGLVIGATGAFAADAETSTYEIGKDRPGGDYRSFAYPRGTSAGLVCRRNCLAESDKCVSWTYNDKRGRCYLKSRSKTKKSCSTCVSGDIKPTAYVSTFESGTDRPGRDYRNFEIPIGNANRETGDAMLICQAVCESEAPKCRAWTFVHPGIQGRHARCWLKKEVPGPRRNKSCCASGVLEPACSVGGQKRLGIGRKAYASGAVVGEASILAPETRRDSKVSGRVEACFAGSCRDLARATMEGHSKGGGSKLSIVVAGRTLHTSNLARKGSRTWKPWIANRKIGGSLPLNTFVSVYARAGFGIETSAAASWDIRALPPLADLSGNARASAFGTGEAGLEVLGGHVGRASLEARIDLPAPDVQARLRTGVCRSRRSDADLILDPWALKVKATGRVGCVWGRCLFSGSKTLINTSGNARRYDFL